MKLNFSFHLLFLLGVCSSVGYAHLLEDPANTGCLPYLTHKSGRLAKQLEGDFSAELKRGNPFRGDFSEELTPDVEKFDLLNDHVNTESVRPFAALINIFEEKCQQIKVNELKASQLPVKTPVKTPVETPIGFRSAQIGLKKSETVGAFAASLTPGFNLKKEESVRQTLQVKASQLPVKTPVETPIRFRSAQIGLKKSGTVGAPAAFGIPLFNHIGFRSASIGLKKSETVGAPARLWTPVLEHKSASQELKEKIQRLESITVHAAKVREERAAKAPSGQELPKLDISANRSRPSKTWPKVSVSPAFRSSDARRSGTVGAPAAFGHLSKAPELARSDSGHYLMTHKISQEILDKMELLMQAMNSNESSTSRNSAPSLIPGLARSDSGYSSDSGRSSSSDSGYSSPGSDIAQSYSDSLEIIREIRSLISTTSGTLGAPVLQRSDSGYSSPGSDIAQSETPGTGSLEIIDVMRSLIGKTLFL